VKNGKKNEKLMKIETLLITANGARVYDQKNETGPTAAAHPACAAPGENLFVLLLLKADQPASRLSNFSLALYGPQ
jgi:hypothetical protein